MTEPVRDLTSDALVAEWEAAKPPTAGAAANLAAAAIVVALGVGGVILSLGLGAGSLREPAPGSWPLAVSVTVTILGLALAARTRATHDAERFTTNSPRVVVALATMIPFGLVIGTIGFEIPSLLLAFVWLRFLGRETWRVSIVGSVLMVAGFYLVFVAALRISIPHLF